MGTMWRARLGRAAALPALRALALFALLALAGGSCSSCARTRPTDVLWIVSDTLRADALSCYGGAAQTPAICSLAERGALFERAYSNGAWTLPSAVALFTGSHAAVHGRRAGAAPGEQGFYYVNDGEVLLAEALRERGYDVLAFVENEMAARPNALQGFELREVFEPRLPGARQVQERLGVDLSDFRYRRILPLLHYLLVEQEHRFFALQWIMDPHAVYFPPKRFLASMTIDPFRLPRPPIFYARLESRSNPERETRDLNALAPGLSDLERRYLKELYLREVESVDERVGYLLEALRVRGLEDRTLVVFTSDHGEGFGEHGLFLHSGRRLYEEFVRVPLLMAGPGVARGVRVTAPVSHVDLVPTLSELLDVPLGQELQGTSFAALLSGGRDASARAPYIADTARQPGYEALVRGRYKLIVTPGGPQLFDLEADRGETSDLSASRPELVAELEAQLEAIRARDDARRLSNLGRGDPRALEAAERQTRDQLEVLGYAE